MTFEATFSIITDPRKDINLKHDLLDILFLVVTALLSNAEGWVDIEEFGRTKEDWLKKYRPFENGIPSHDTIARVMSILDPDTLNQCFISWVNQIRDHQDLQTDNGAPMKAQTMRMKAYELGVVTSYSRPRVSNDNPFAESLFKTCKYRPDWPTDGFNSLDEARAWVLRFTHWYNMEHKHSQLRFVTPNERHMGEDKVILANRKQTIESAKALNPARWGGREVRDCTPVPPTTLIPVKEPKSIDKMRVA